MLDQIDLTVLSSNLPEGLPADVQNQLAELRVRAEALEATQSGLDREREQLHEEINPFAAAEDHRIRVLESWRTEAKLWRDMRSFAGDALDALRLARIEAAGKHTAARDEAKRDFYAIHTAEATDYDVSSDETVATLSHKEATIRNAERRWTPAMAEAEPMALVCDRRVKDAIREMLRPILEPLA